MITITIRQEVPRPKSVSIVKYSEVIQPLSDISEGEMTVKFESQTVKCILKFCGTTEEVCVHESHSKTQPNFVWKVMRLLVLGDLQIRKKNIENVDIEDECTIDDGHSSVHPDVECSSAHNSVVYGLM